MLPVPGELSDVEAASLPETFFTVWQNVFHIAGLVAGEWLLVQGGSSGIGVTAIQLAKARGARLVIGIDGTADTLDDLVFLLGYGREYIESGEDSAKLAKMESDGLLKTHKFADRAKLLELAEPVKKAFAEELGATAVLEKINSIK